MRRLAGLGIVILLIITLLGFFRRTKEPEVFSGIWYSAENQCAYSFREGLIYRTNPSAPIPEGEGIRGAYAYSRDTVYLFAEGIPGLETERMLYFHHSGDGDFLCENRDGTGMVYFIRYHE